MNMNRKKDKKSIMNKKTKNLAQKTKLENL